jgi:hypothetical protein
MRILIGALILAAAALLVVHENVDAIGRGGAPHGGGKGGGGARPGGGGGRPAAHAPARPAHTPSVNPHASRPAPRPQAQRPAPQRPAAAQRPAVQQPRPAVAKMPQQQRPAMAKSNFQMPGNTHRPAQLPNKNPVQVVRPGGGGAGTLNRPGFNPGKPDIGKLGPSKPGGITRPGFDKNRPSLADLQKKNPGGVFDRPKPGGGDRFPGAGNLPNQRPGDRKGDLTAWASLPNRPGGGGGGTQWDPKTRPNFDPKNRPGKDGGGIQKRPDFDPKRPDFDPKKRPDFDPKRPDFDPKKRPNVDPNDRPIIDPKNRPNFDPNRPAFDGKNRPDRPWAATRPSSKINNEFTNNWKKAVNKKTNIGKIGDTKIGKIGDTNVVGNRIGDVDVDNYTFNNFQQLNDNRRLVNNNFRNYGGGGYFNDNWWNNRPYAANYPAWHYHHSHLPAANWWRGASWAGLTGWMAGNAWSQPAYTDYGSNVVIDQDVVYLNDQPVASAPVYAQQAIELATIEPPPPEVRLEWMPLGTWALMSDKEDANPSSILQLAVSKEGLVSGTWYNRNTDKSAECEGQVDPETQRMALRRPEQPDVVLEVGLYNLTQNATSCLIHFGTINSQAWYLARLDDPNAAQQ